MCGRTIFFLSGCHLSTEMFTGILQGEPQSPLKGLRALLRGWLPENTEPGWLVKQKNIVFISGERWQPKHVTKGRVCKTVPLPLNPSHFLDRKKKRSVVLVVAGFLSCDKFPADPGMLPTVLLPARGLCWLSGKHFILSWPPRCQLSVAPVSPIRPSSVICWVLGELQWLRRTLLFRSTVCWDRGQWLGSYLKVTFNKKQIKI